MKNINAEDAEDAESAELGLRMAKPGSCLSRNDAVQS